MFLVIGYAAVNMRTRLSATNQVSVLIATCLGLFIITDPSFLYHSLYVHSHLMSAAYLLLALFGLRMSFDPGTRRATPEAKAWLIVAGIATAGLALARPDGLAYMFTPIIIATAILSDPRREEGDWWRFHLPLLLVVCVSFAGAYATTGMWDADKLDGRMSAALLGLMVLSAMLTAVIRAPIMRDRLPLGGPPALIAALAIAAITFVIATITRFDVMSLAALNAWANLFVANGAYAYLWPSLTLVLGLSILTGDATKRDSWSSYLFATIVLFFLTAALVHGTSHPGRVGTGDSFSRVSFHILPTALWYVAMVAARVLGEKSGARKQRAENLTA